MPTKTVLQTYIDHRRQPVSAAQGSENLHLTLCQTAPHLYPHLLADPVAHISHKRQVLTNLFTLLEAADWDRDAVLAELHSLPPAEALKILEVLVEQRINGHRARTLGLTFLMSHPQLVALAATRRQRMIRLCKHFLGERTWAAVCRALAAPSPKSGNPFLRVLGRQRPAPESPTDQMLHDTILRYARDEATAREALSFLAGVAFTPTDQTLAKRVAARQDIEQGEGLPRETLFGLRGIYHPEVAKSRIRYLSAIEPAGKRHDGPLTTLYKTALSDGAREDQAQELERWLTDAGAMLPEGPQRIVVGPLAIVLDLSSSMAASGERLNHPAALGLALARILQARVEDVSLYQVGGGGALPTDPFPPPQGETDLALAVLSAARQSPTAILVITDGYENVRQGDLADVVRGMAQLGLGIPVYQVVPRYVLAEELARRRLAPTIPLIPVDHESGINEVAARLLLARADETLSSSDLSLLQHLLFGR